ncbi:hypothetical protein QBC35DRAFT_535336 [Podospora australis]|uniref:NADH-cytochrome b5 reductase 1 n=1 Tax=Podospora australis TaxID=1536484 RepID=A0AAN7ACV3_9PEZI|nr:hypothetical protein QBC35DRAFT_535336 [Podospora australis]
MASTSTTFALADVQKHNQPDDLWIVINNKVYDISKYLEDHPGGTAVLNEVAGNDASAEFIEVGHSAEAIDSLENFYVGDLIEDEHIEEVEVFRPTFHNVGQTAAVIVTRKNSSKNSRSLSRRSLPLLTTAVTIGIGAAVWTGKGPKFLGRVRGDALVRLLRKPLASVSHALPPNLDLPGTGTANVFWLGVGATTLAQLSLSIVLGGWAWSKLDVQQEFTHYPAHRKAKKSRHMPILKVPTVSGPSKVPAAPTRIAVLDAQEWRKFKLVRKTLVSPNVYKFVFALPSSHDVLGLPTGQHIALRATVDGKTVARSYTPISNNSDLGRIELLIKVYDQGLMTKHLEAMKVGETIDIRGPKGAMQYKPLSYAKHIGMIAGGTGITPMFQMIRAIVEDDTDTTTLSLLYASNTENDILLREELDGYALRCPEKFRVQYVLAHPDQEWAGLSGFINADMIKEHLPGPSSDTKMLLCGPPPMVNAMSKTLVSLGFAAPSVMSKATDQVFLF